MNSRHLQVTVFTIFVSISPVPVFGEAGFWGASCDETSKLCAQGHWLECKPSAGEFKFSTCQCLEGMVAGELDEPCVSKIGSPCQTEVKLYGIKNCVRNGYCANGLCQCELGFEPSTSNQTCLITYGSNLTCTGIHDCNYNRGLQCIHQGQGAQNGGICSCYPFKEIWDTKIRKCLNKIGSPCSETEKCVENGECLNGLCSCSGDFKTTPSKECKKNYGRPCVLHGLDSDCHPNFHCLPFGPDHKLTCTCSAGTEIFHDSHCDRIPGQSCTPDVTPCVPNSVCRSGKCTCIDGFEPGEGGRCVLGHGGDCSWSPSDACNTQAKLVCGKDPPRCECQRNYEYDPKLKTCRGLPGVPCNSTVPSDCYALAECNLKEGKCACIGGYSNNTPDGRCQLTHDQSCSLLSHCNPFDFLRCDVKTRRCVCEEGGMWWDPERKSCQATVGTLCFLNPVDSRQLSCVRNGHCVRGALGGGSPDHGICECSPGFGSSQLGFCDQKQTSGSGKQGVTISIFSLLIIVSLFY